jgi:hypothetical protein
VLAAARARRRAAPWLARPFGHGESRWPAGPSRSRSCVTARRAQRRQTSRGTPSDEDAGSNSLAAGSRPGAARCRGHKFIPSPGRVKNPSRRIPAMELSNSTESVKKWCLESLKSCSDDLLGRLAENIIKEQVDKEVLFSVCEDGESFFAKLLFGRSTQINPAPHKSCRSAQNVADYLAPGILFRKVCRLKSGGGVSSILQRGYVCISLYIALQYNDERGFLLIGGVCASNLDVERWIGHCFEAPADEPLVNRILVGPFSSQASLQIWSYGITAGILVNF